jgi:tRNA uridine 5-carboxymethylaminomethyl modification enzyme
VEEERKVLHGITEDLINAGFEGKNENRNASKSGWTFFGLFKNERRKGDAKPDKFSYSDVTSPLIHQRSCHDVHVLKCMIF